MYIMSNHMKGLTMNITTTVEKEIERKWLARRKSELVELMVACNAAVRKDEILQAYVGEDRYRIMNTFVCDSSVLRVEKTRKTGEGMIREEHTTEISAEQAIGAVSEAGASWMCKTRYHIPFGDYTFQVDYFYDTWWDSDSPGSFPQNPPVYTITVEVEFKSEEDALAFPGNMTLPDWVGDEVTGINEYTAKGIYERK